MQHWKRASIFFLVQWFLPSNMDNIFARPLSEGEIMKANLILVYQFLCMGSFLTSCWCTLGGILVSALFGFRKTFFHSEKKYLKSKKKTIWRSHCGSLKSQSLRNGFINISRLIYFNKFLSLEFVIFWLRHSVLLVE